MPKAIDFVIFLIQAGIFFSFMYFAYLGDEFKTECKADINKDVPLSPQPADTDDTDGYSKGIDVTR